MTIVPLTSSDTHLYSLSALVFNPLEIISLPEVVSSPRGIGGVQLYPLGADGAIITEVSLKALTLIPGTVIEKWENIFWDLLHNMTHFLYQLVLLMNCGYPQNY